MAGFGSPLRANSPHPTPCTCDVASRSIQPRCVFCPEADVLSACMTTVRWSPGDQCAGEKTGSSCETRWSKVMASAVRNEGCVAGLVPDRISPALVFARIAPGLERPKASGRGTHSPGRG
jgi:hypothetical protein